MAADNSRVEGVESKGGYFLGTGDNSGISTSVIVQQPCPKIGSNEQPGSTDVPRGVCVNVLLPIAFSLLAGLAGAYCFTSISPPIVNDLNLNGKTSITSKRD